MKTTNKKFLTLHKKIQNNAIKNGNNSHNEILIRHWNLLYRIAKEKGLDLLIKTEDPTRTKKLVNPDILVFLAKKVEIEFDKDALKSFYLNNYSNEVNSYFNNWNTDEYSEFTGQYHYKSSAIGDIIESYEEASNGNQEVSS